MLGEHLRDEGFLLPSDFQTNRQSCLDFCPKITFVFTIGSFGYVAWLVAGATQRDAALSAPAFIATSLTGRIFHPGLLR
jgi:hypothetical protein